MVNQSVLTPTPLTSGPGIWAATPARVRSRQPGLAVDVINDTGTFAGMESIWNEVVDRASVPYPFLRHEWLRTWWQCFGAGRRLHILVVRSAGKIVAIAPLMWETARMYGVTVRRLRLMQNDHTPQADMIIAGQPDESYRAIWHSLLTATEPWDVLQLSEVPSASPSIEALRTLADKDGHATGIWKSDDSPYLPIDRSWDAYAASLSAGFRQNLRNRWSRLTRLGSPALEVLQDRAAIDNACEDALRLEASGWKHQAGTAIQSDAPTRRFYTELAGHAADRGWLRLLFLTIDGRRIATAYSASYRNRLLFLKTGYDPEFAKCSPFKMLTYLTLREAFTTGVAEVDFLGTAEPWKLEWTSSARPHDWLFVFGKTARARIVHQLKFRLKPTLQKFTARSSRLANGQPRTAASE